MQIRGSTEAGNRRFGVAITLAGVAVISPNGVLVELITADLWTLIFWRGLMMAAALGVYLLLRYRGGVMQVVCAGGTAALAAGALLAIALTMFVVAVKLSTIANTLFILSAAPLCAALFSRLFLGEAVTASTWLAVVLVIVGMGIIVADGLELGYSWGNLAALSVAVSFGGALTVLRYARLRDAVPAMTVGGLLVAVISFPLAPTIVLTGNDILLTALLGLVVLPVSFGLISHGPRYIPAPEVSLIMLLEAVLGTFWAWLIVSELPAPQALIGGTLILATLCGYFAHGLRGSRRLERA